MRSVCLSIGLVACASSPSLAVRAAERPAAPAFTLEDLEGREHSLEALRGRVVVLEWTSHLCPAVARAHETRLVADTCAALGSEEREEVVWLQVDSSWFAPALTEGIRAWRAWLGLEVPYLLDPDGAIAREYDVHATPCFVVVDAQGRVAYRGALVDGAWEPERRNFVVEAVGALLAGQEVELATQPARGCSPKLAPPPPGARAAEQDEDARAHALYAEAAQAVAAGELERANDALRRAFEAGLPRPARVLADPAFRPLLADAAARAALRDELASRPARGALTMVAPDEPGEPFVLCGTVRDVRGAPIADAQVSLYHTDAAGWYSAGSTSGENPRLFGRVLTDANGRYRIRTVQPGYYAESDEGLMHVHMGFRAPGFRPHEGHRASLYFDDDPFMRGAWRDEIEGDGCAIRPRARNAEGAILVVYDVSLRR